jgi:hypothetical protein
VYVGLVMHSGFNDAPDEELFARAYELIAGLAHTGE